MDYFASGFRMLLLICLFSAGFAGADQASAGSKTIRLGSVRDMVWSAARSRIYICSGTSIVAVDPQTAVVVDTVATNVTADRLAISDDGQYLYASIPSRGVIQRYLPASNSLDLEIDLGGGTAGKRYSASSMVVLPGQGRSLVISMADADGGAVQVIDGASPRRLLLLASATELWLRPSDGLVYGVGSGHVYRFAVDAGGVSVARDYTLPMDFGKNAALVWNGGLVADRAGTVFDLDSGRLRGGLSLAPGCALTPDDEGKSILTVQFGGTDLSSPELARYSLSTFRPISRGKFGITHESNVDCSALSRVVTWGTDGVALGTSDGVVLLRPSGLDPVVSATAPQPQTDSSGITRLDLTLNDVVFDGTRNLLWATVAAGSPALANQVVSIDPVSGQVVDAIEVGSEPGQAALSGDASRLFIRQLATEIGVVDLNAKQRARGFSVLDGSQQWATSSIVGVQNTSNTVAVIRIPFKVSYGSNISVYDDGIVRPESSSNFKAGVSFADTRSLTTVLIPGEAPDVLYGINSQSGPGDGTHSVFRYRINQNGITLDRALNSIRVAGAPYGVALVTQGGSFYTGGGEVWNQNIDQLLGTFSLRQTYASGALPVPFLDQNRIVFAYYDGLTGAAAVTLFDLATKRPLASLPLAGVRNAVRAGPASVALMLDRQLMIVPLGSLPSWPQASTGNITTAAGGFRNLAFPVKSLAGGPGSESLLFSVPANAGEAGNTVMSFNPSTTRVDWALNAGSEPDMLSLSPDGGTVYARFSGEQKIAQIDTVAGKADAVFGADPYGAGRQFPFYDMAALPNGGVAVSYFGGAIAAFDNGVARPVFDLNDQGAYAFLGGTLKLGVSGDGTKIYGQETRWSPGGTKRSAVTPQGVQWLSTIEGVYLDPNFVSAGGLLFDGRGNVMDPERSRIVADFAFPGNGSEGLVAPDLAGGRVYFLRGDQILMYDAKSHELLGKVTVPFPFAGYGNLVRFGKDGLAFLSQTGVGLASISAIPLLASPIPSAQPKLPQTPGVMVVDLQAQDLAWDASRSVLYVATPNREGPLGDKIQLVDPSTGTISGGWTAGPNPNHLALADGQSRLSYTAGAVNNVYLSGFSVTSEGIRSIDPNTGQPPPGATGMPFPARDSTTGLSYNYLDLITLPGQRTSLAAIDSAYQAGVVDGSPITYGLGLDSVRIFDDGVLRPRFLGPHGASCASMVAAPAGDRIYCSSGAALTRFAIDPNGISLLDSFPLLPGRGPFGHMILDGGKIYTSTGQVLDPEAKKTIARVVAQGPVAIDGNTVYWLDQSAWTVAKQSAILRSFDKTTLQPVAARQINVSQPDAVRLIVCGAGRLAFSAGREIYVVNP